MTLIMPMVRRGRHHRPRRWPWVLLVLGPGALGFGIGWGWYVDLPDAPKALQSVPPAAVSSLPPDGHGVGLPLATAPSLARTLAATSRPKRTAAAQTDVVFVPVAIRVTPSAAVAALPRSAAKTTAPPPPPPVGPSSTSSVMTTPPTSGVPTSTPAPTSLTAVPKLPWPAP